MDKIRLMVIDDDPDWIRAMKLFLGKEEDMELTAAASSVKEAIEMVVQIPVDIILMDINLPDEDHDGISLTAELLLDRKIRIIMLTSSNEDKDVLDSFAAGAVNYVNKVNYREIPLAIRSAFGTSSPRDVLIRDYARLREIEYLSVLTPMEKEIMYLLGEGLTQSQIRKKLFKSESTLKNQINAILKKLHVKNTREALRKIKTRGIIK